MALPHKRSAEVPDARKLDLLNHSHSTVRSRSRVHAKENVLEDSLCQILLDKDGILPAIPESSDATHRVKKPTKERFAAICNEFWWCLNNVAKGLWRGEPTYAQDMLNKVVRVQLLSMLSFKVGILTDYSVSVGKTGKYLPKWLSEEEWKAYLATCSGTDIDAMWDSVETMCDLFSKTARFVAEKSGFTYNEQEETGCLSYLQRVRNFPAGCTEI